MKALRSAWLVLAILAIGAPGPTQEFHRTGDGSRFLLLPTAGPRLVHWALASPAGPSEDPVGYEGLSYAVLLASLYGTSTIGTLDSERERLALDRIATLQRALTGAGSPDDQLQVQLTAARMETISLRDPAGFRRVLASAPTTNLQVHRAPRAGVLVLTTVPESLGRVAELLLARREDNRLRALEETLEEIRSQERRRWDAEPLQALRSEAVSLAFAGHAWARAAPREPGAHRLQREIGMSVWHDTQRPARCLHVLTGNFEPAAVRRTLDAVFARTELTAGESAPAGPPRWPASVRRADVPMSGPASAVVAMRAPEVDLRTMQWVGDLLAGGETSLLAQALQRRGRQGMQVSWSGPLPALAPGACLLLEVVDPAGGEGLGEDCLAALPDIADRLAEPPSLDAVRNARQRERALVAGDPQDLAGWLAVRLLPSPDPAADLRAFLREPARAAVLDAVRAILQAANPVVVESRIR